MFASILKNLSTKAKSLYSTVLKFNPYHGPDGRFASHGSATFVSLSGKRYANILDPKNQGKNAVATIQNFQKLQTSAYNFGKNMRDALPSPADKKLFDQAQLQAGMVKAYGVNQPGYAGADILNNAVANAYAKSGLTTKHKQSLGFPLTQQEHDLIEAGIKKQNEKANLKAKIKAAKAYEKAFVKASMDADKYEYLNKPAKMQAAQVKLQKLGNAFMEAGGTADELTAMALKGFDKKDAEKATIKKLITAKSLEYYKANFKAMGTMGKNIDDEAAAALKAEANKLFVDNKFFLGTDGPAQVQEAKKLFEDWKGEHKADFLKIFKQYKDDPNASPDDLYNKRDQLLALGFSKANMNDWKEEGYAAMSKPTPAPSQMSYEDSQKNYKLSTAVYHATKVHHSAVLGGGNADTIAELKAAQVAAMDAAEAGKVSLDTIKYQVKIAQETADDAYQAVVKMTKGNLNDYAHAFATARMNGDMDEAATQGAYFHNAAVDAAKLVTPAELATIKATANDKAEASHKAVQAFKEAVGDPHKVMAAYDAASVFEYPIYDNAFAKNQGSMIDRLPTETLGVLKNYTGASYQDINKAAGTYGTEKMKGLEPNPISSGVKTQIKNLDKAFSQIKLGKNVALRRNMPQKYFWSQLGIKEEDMNSLSVEQLKAFVGKTYKETAFGSASMDPDFSGAFSKAGSASGLIKLNIRAHAETHAVMASHISSHNSEHEVIMGRGTTYVIRSIRSKVNGSYRYEVDVDVIGTFPDSLD